MATALAIKPRGAKRKCQNETCAMPFYDLNRETFACPNCGQAYDTELQARLEAAALASRSGQRRYGRQQFPMPVVAAAVEPEVAEVETVVGEIADDATEATGEDVILEQEDENDGAVDLGPLPEDGNSDE